MLGRHDSGLAMLRLSPIDTLATVLHNWLVRVQELAFGKTSPELKMGFCPSVVEERNRTPVTVRSDGAAF